MPAALERSHSGKGGHIWIFFGRALPLTANSNIILKRYAQHNSHRHSRPMEPNWGTELSSSSRRSINLQTRSGPRSTNLKRHPFPAQSLAITYRKPFDDAEAEIAQGRQKPGSSGLRSG